MPNPDPELESAINGVPPIKLTAKQLSKTGWTNAEGHPYIIVGHYPKAFRVPTSRHPKCVIRTTWVFRDGAWHLIEDKVDIRVLEV